MSKSADTISAQAPGKRSGTIGRLSRAREVRLMIALLVIGLVVTLREPRFLQASNLEQVALSATLVCIVAVGEALVIIARQVDLSVGAIVAMSAFVSASWLEADPSSPLVFVFLIGCGVGLAMGAGSSRRRTPRRETPAMSPAARRRRDRYPSRPARQSPLPSREESRLWKSTASASAHARRPTGDDARAIAPRRSSGYRVRTPCPTAANAPSGFDSF